MRDSMCSASAVVECQLSRNNVRADHVFTILVDYVRIMISYKVITDNYQEFAVLRLYHFPPIDGAENLNICQ